MIYLCLILILLAIGVFAYLDSKQAKRAGFYNTDIHGFNIFDENQQ